MASKVEIQLPSGEWVFRTSETITEEEASYPMRCCGTYKGHLCHAPMIPVRNTKPVAKITFRQKNDECVHILGCSCDERRNYHTSKSDDYRAEGKTTEDIFLAMSKKRSKGITGGSTHSTPTHAEGDEGYGGRTDTSLKPVKRIRDLPSAAGLLAEILTTLSIDAPYANTYVRNLIVDARTVYSFRNSEMLDGHHALVIAKRLAVANRGFEASEKELVLADCKYNPSTETNPDAFLKFRISAHGKARDKLFAYLTSKGENTYVAIFAKWHKDSDNKNTYFAEKIGEAHVDIIRLPD